MKLSKPWVWRENAIIYTHPSQVIHQPYPFYWYRATGLQIELIKQVSKFCGIVQDWNEYIKPDPVQVVEAVVEAPVLSVEEMYIDRRSWMTLGDVPYDPIDQIETYTWGNRRVQLSFTPDGQLFERKEWTNDQISFVSQYNYSKKKDRYFANYYKNSDGVECNKIDKGWNWITGKPIIEKKYGKR
jgi:hypothetical protein